MLKRTKRVLICILSLCIISTCFPLNIFAEEDVIKTYVNIEDVEIEDSIRNQNLFYIQSKPIQIAEETNEIYLMKVGRGGDAKEKAHVELKIKDITAAYGKDYVIRTHSGGNEVEVPKDNESVLDAIVENEDAIIEENSSQEIVEQVQNEKNGTVEEKKDESIDEVQTEENADEEKAESVKEEAKEEKKSENNKQEADKETNTSVEATKKEEEKSALKDAKEKATGLESDKTRMSGGDNFQQKLDDYVAGMTYDLGGATLLLEFDENEKEKLVEIEVKDNKKGDGNRIFQISLGNTSENMKNSARSGTMFTIVDNEQQEDAKVQFSNTVYNAEEGYIKVDIKRSGALNQMVGAALVTNDGTAKNGTDYSKVETNVVFPFGITTRTVYIPVNNENLKSSKSFTLELKDPMKGTKITQGKATANLALKNKAALMSKEAKNSSKLKLGPAIDLPKNAFSPGAHKKGYSKSSGKTWVLYAKDTWNDVSSWVNFKTDKEYSYSGYNIKWKRESGKPNYGYTSIQFNQGDKGGSTNWEEVHRNNEERWGSKELQIYSKKDKITTMYFEVRRNGGWTGTSPMLTIEEIKPIRRQFNVTSIDGDPLYFLDENGDLKENTQINNKDIKEANKAYLASTIRFAGDDGEAKVTVNENSAYSYLKGVKIVNGKKSKVIVDNLAYGTSSYSFNIDEKFIKNNLDYINFVANGNQGKRGEFKVQPILGYLNTEVVVEEDIRGDLVMYDDEFTLSDGVENEYYIQNESDGKYLSYGGNSVKKGASIITGNYKQKWKISNAGNGRFFIRLASNPKYGLDVGGASNAENVKIYLWESFNRVNQRFKLRSNKDGTYDILAECSEGVNRILSLDSNNTVLQKTDKNQSSQQWKLIPVDNKVTFHKGDTIKLSAKIHDESLYYVKGMNMRFYNNSGVEVENSVKNYLGNNQYLSQLLSSGIGKVVVKPNYQEKDNAIIVRVHKDDLKYFDTSQGIFKSPKREIKQGYIEYLVSDENNCMNGNYYEFNAPLLSDENVNYNKSMVARWEVNSPQYGKRYYSQNTLYYKANEKKKDNIIYVKPVKASNTLYSLSAHVSYNNTTLGGQITNGTTIDAEGAVIRAGEYLGVSDKDGKVETMPMPAIENDYIVIKAEASGTVDYQTVKVDGRLFNKRKEVTMDDKKYTVATGSLNEYKVPLIDSTRPHLLSAYAQSSENTSSELIYIDKDNRYKFSLETANDKVKYVDASGKIKEEKIKRVELLVVNGITFEVKGEPINTTRSKNNSNLWEVTKSFSAEDVSKWTAGDKIYARVVTDRRTAEAEAGQSGDAFSETMYQPVDLGYVFAYPDSKIPVTQDINLDTNMAFMELPVIGNMTANFNVWYLNLQVIELPDNGLRLGIGAVGKFDKLQSNGNFGQNDNGVNYGKTDLKGAIKGAKEFGKEVGSKTTVGKGGWGIFPTFGLYMDFGIKEISLGDYEDTIMEPVFLGGGMYLGVSGAFKLTQYFAISFVPVYFGIDGQLSAYFEGGLKTLVDPMSITPSVIQKEDNSLEKYTDYDIMLQSQNQVNAYVGVGLNGTLGVRGGFNLGLNYIYNPTIKHLYDDVNVNGLNLSANIKVTVDALIFSIPVPALTLADKDFGYYEDIKGKTNTTKTADFMAGNQTVTMRSRDKTPSQWVANTPALFSSFEQTSTQTLLTNGYDHANPQLIDLGNGKVLMVFLDDDVNRSDADRTILKFSIYENGVWSKPQAIQKDGTADFEPNVADAGDSVMISWTSRDAGAKDDEISYVKSLDVYTVLFNKKTLTFGTIDRLCTDEYFDANPVGLYDETTGDRMVYYLKSEVSDDFATSVNPNLNESVIVYMLYDAKSNKWMRDDYFDNEVASPEDEEELIKNWGGQRFLSSVIKDFGNDEDGTMTDPVITDFNAISYNGLGVYAFTVDEDNNMDTDSDRELFIQVYNFESHKTYYPIRITNNNVNDTMPQLVRKGDHTYLFWAENNEDINYISVTDLVKKGIDKNGTVINDEYLKPSKVFFAQEDENIKPTFGSFKPYVDADGDLYVIWLQPAKDENGNSCQEIFASAYTGNSKENIDYDKESEGEEANQEGSWSEGVRLTYNGLFNDEPAFVAKEDGTLLVVNNQYKLNLDDSAETVSDVKLVATEYGKTGSVEVVDVKYDKELPQANSDMLVTATVKNTGLKPAEGYTLEVYEYANGAKSKHIKTLKSDEMLTPSGKSEVELTWKIPEEFEGKSLVFETKETGFDNIDKFVSDPLKQEVSYEFVSNKIKQEEDGFYIETVIRNNGNKVLTAEEKHKLVVNFNDIYFTGANEKTYLSKDITSLGINEQMTIREKLNISEEDMKNGYVNVVQYVTDKSNAEFSDAITTRLALTSPMNISINNIGDVIEIKEGDKLPLSVSYSNADYFKDGKIVFNSNDASIATVVDNELIALNGGETNLQVSLEPFGTTKTIKVIVKGKELEKQPEDNRPAPDAGDGTEFEGVNSGEKANIELYISLLLGTILVLGALYIYKKKEKTNS